MNKAKAGMRSHKELATDVIIGLFWVFFAYNHLVAYFTYHHKSFLLIVISETLLFILYMMRSRVRSISEEPWDWFCAVAATFGGLLFIPAEIGAVAPIGEILLVIGLSIQIASILALNRRIGIIPANRGIQSRWVYSVIRHPMYAAYMFVYMGYVINFPTFWNTGVMLMSVAFQIFRIHNEEKHLAKDEIYRTYTANVKWRLLPYIY